MTYFNLSKAALIFSLLATLCINGYAADKETTQVTTTTTQSPSGDTVVKEVTKTTKIITPVPAAKENVTAPTGYVTCFNVEEGWFDNVWVPTHQVCQYENSGEGVVWVGGYWGCNKATPEGVCSNWEWKVGHWEKKLVVY